MQLGRNLLQFIPPRLQAGEWDRNEEAAELAVPAYIRRAARERALEWTVAPPRPTRAANYYVGRSGESEYIMVRVEPGDEYEPGLRWFGPLPEPRE